MFIAMMSRATFARRHLAETEWELSNQAAEDARLIWAMPHKQELKINRSDLLVFAASIQVRGISVSRSPCSTALHPWICTGETVISYTESADRDRSQKFSIIHTFKLDEETGIATCLPSGEGNAQTTCSPPGSHNTWALPCKSTWRRTPPG